MRARHRFVGGRAATWCCARCNVLPTVSIPDPVSFVADAQRDVPGLTLEGLVFLLVSVGGILVLLVWSYRRLLQHSGSDDESGSG